MCAEFTTRAAEEIRKDILQRSKGDQCTVKMTDHKVGRRVRVRTCKVQVRPTTVSKGIQVDIKEKQGQDINTPVLYSADASSQTTETSFKGEDDTFEEEVDNFQKVDDEDDERNDPTYQPDTDSDNAHEEVHQRAKPVSILEEEKYIVFESQLLSLFNTCTSCLSKRVNVVKVRPKCFGSQLKIEATCENCDHRQEWYSQPRVGNAMAGNILLSCAILYGGVSPTKILRMLSHVNIKVISVQTFLDHQRDYLLPTITRIYHRQQSQLLQQIGEDEKLVLGGDGRHDSPGHCAKYGSYTLMDMKRNKVIDIQLVQSNEVASSNKMEMEGLQRSLAFLYTQEKKIGTLITDRHGQVAKWLRENCPEINHRYDVWHIAKAIKKKLTALSKKRDCEAAGLWKRSIVNHVYWCAASTPNGDGEEIAAKYRSLMNHVKNVHTGHDDRFPRCEHSDDYPQREWLTEGTQVYEKMDEALMKTRLVNELKKMSPLAQTSSVEAFHNVILHWAPKMLAYSYPGMKCRLFLAALHWNENADREQARTADGTPVYRITFPKAKGGGHAVARVMTSCTFNYVNALIEETLQLVSRKEKLGHTIPELQHKPALCAEFVRPDRADAIRQLEVCRRFART